MIATLALATAIAGGHTEDRCSIVRSRDLYVPEETETLAIGSVLPGALSTRVAPERADTFIRPVVGQTVRLESVEGQAVARGIESGDTVAVFMWVVQMDCSWGSRGEVLPDSTRQHFTMTLRPDTLWVQGRPTFDVVPEEGLTVYPGAGEGARGVTVDDYAEFVSLIPTRAEWEADCRPGVRETNQWIWAPRHGGSRPFSNVIESLVGACEASVHAKARSYASSGPHEMPSALLAWSRSAGCSVDESRGAVPGTFMPDVAAEQWAVLCETVANWRLLIVVPSEARVLAELASGVGPAFYRYVEVVAPPYFEWASSENTSLPANRRPPPEQDTVLFELYLYFWRNGAWTSEPDSCCSFRY